MNSNAKQKFLTTTLIFIFVSCAPAPTQTATAEFTKTIESTPIPTIAYTDTPSPTSTPEVKTIINNNYLSLDGMWTAVISTTTEGINKNLLFKVSNNITYKSWVIENIDFAEPKNPLDGYKYPYIFKWSKDGNYLYYSHLSTGGDGCFGLFKPGGLDLQRLNLTSGETITISRSGGIWMALSPNESELAYIDTWGGNISILDIESKEEKTYLLPPIENKLGMTTDTSDIYWAPDGTSLIYSHRVGVCDLLTPYSNIIQLYPSTGKQKLLVENDEHGYVPIEWKTSEKILLTNNENNLWWLNPTTKEIIPAQP